VVIDSVCVMRRLMCLWVNLRSAYAHALVGRDARAHGQAKALAVVRRESLLSVWCVCVCVCVCVRARARMYVCVYVCLN